MHGGVSSVGIYVASEMIPVKMWFFYPMFFQISGKKPCYDTNIHGNINPPTDAVDKPDYVFK